MEPMVSGVGVVDKSFALVALVSGGPRTLSELVEGTDLSRATAHRLAVALEAHGVLRRTTDGRFALGLHLVALGRAHDLLLQARWANASLANTIRGATEPYDSEGAGRFLIEGPDIRITSGAVIALAMTLNELCTNTTKFGALSVPAGRIEIGWKIDANTQRVQLTWAEKDGPPVHAPSRRSFGTRLIGSLGQQLKGEVQLAYDASGFVYVLDVPMASLVAPG